jgi:hypothetical protein
MEMFEVSQKNIGPHAESQFCRAADAVKVTPFGIRAFNMHVRTGKIPSYKFGTNRFFKKEEVIAAIERCRISTQDEILQ